MNWYLVIHTKDERVFRFQTPTQGDGLRQIGHEAGVGYLIGQHHIVTWDGNEDVVTEKREYMLVVPWHNVSFINIQRYKEELP